MVLYDAESSGDQSSTLLGQLIAEFTHFPIFSQFSHSVVTPNVNVVDPAVHSGICRNYKFKQRAKIRKCQVRMMLMLWLFKRPLSCTAATDFSKLVCNHLARSRGCQTSDVGVLCTKRRDTQLSLDTDGFKIIIE